MIRIKVVLNNHKFPEDGSVTVTLPIESKDYDHVIRQLDGLAIGSAKWRDCGLVTVMDGPDVLNRLEDSEINIEELDYLAKRLDSFTESELATYSALALKHDLTDMTDLINLCDCCQEALIVTDFSNMSRIGREYALAQNGGGMAVEELEKLNLVAVARNLLSGNTGTVTPYGVLYDEEYLVLPQQNFNAYFGSTAFSQKWVAALNGKVIEKKSSEGVCKYKIAPQQIQGFIGGAINTPP